LRPGSSYWTIARASAGADGQLDLEAGSGWGAVGGLNAAPGGRDDGAGDGQAQPAMRGRPAVVPEIVAGAGGVAGVEDLVQRLFRNARPVVFHRERQSLDRALRPRALTQGKQDAAALRHRLGGVLDQVDQNPGQLLARQPYRQRAALGIHGESDGGTCQGRQQIAIGQHFPGQIVDRLGGHQIKAAGALLLARAEQKDFKASIYWETAPGSGREQIDGAIADLVYVLSRYGANRAFLKVDQKPVIFVYGRVMGQVPLASWPMIIEGARAKAGDFLLIADGYQPTFARLFDGMHTYNNCAEVQGKSPEVLRAWAARNYAETVNLARQHRRISCVTVIPGYDDTKIRKHGLAASRQDGQT